jgi:dihydroflavonol-4-reductase
MARTAFVTGATGFVGLNLVEELLAQNWRVIGLHRAASDLSGLDRFPAVERVVGDVTDLRSLRAVVPAGIDCLFHAAGNTSLWAQTHVEQFKINVRGTRNVVRIALEKKATRLVHVSSIVAYGLHSGTISEDTPTRGSSSKINYVRSKALAEREVRRALTTGLDAVIVNPSNIIGAYDTHSWSRMLVLVQQGRLPAVAPGGGSFCHAREVAAALIAAAERGRCGHNYLLGGAQASYAGLVHHIARVLGIRRRVVALPPPVLRTYARLEEWVAPLFGRTPDVTRDAVALLSLNLYCHSRKAQQELGYRPQPLETMLKDARDWLRAQGRLPN